MIKKMLSVIICLSMLVGLSVCVCAQAEGSNASSVEADVGENNSSENSLVKAKAAILIDADSGTVLYRLNENKKLPLASVTKIMTMLLVMEAIRDGKLRYEDKIACSKYAQKMGGSQIWMEEGEQFSVLELLKATAVASANDACALLGEAVAGSAQGFVKLMNDRAKELGMNNTHFDNCTGLDDTTEKQYSSAYDIAVMSRELLKHKEILEYTTIWMDSLRGGKTELVNTNRLIRSYSGITGLKTGTTSKAGFCISARATRSGTSLISVILGSETSEERFESAANLLDWGFANFESVNPKIDIGKISKIEIVGGEEGEITPVFDKEAKILVEKGSSDGITMSIESPKSLSAPIEKGQKIGKLVFKLNGKTVGKIDLISSANIKKLTYFTVLKKLLLGCVSK